MKKTKCLTPGAIYSVGGTESGTVIIKIRVPRAGSRVSEYMKGYFGITTAVPGDAGKLARYEESYAARDRIAADIHDALEPIIGKLYRTVWELGIAGKVIDGETMPSTYDEYLVA